MTPVRLEMPAGPASFRYLVLDFTGTLSRDGSLLPGVAGRLRTLAEDLQVSVLTADTFGTVREALSGLPVTVTLIATGVEKAHLVEELGAEDVVAIGNGRNDIPMAEIAGLSIAVVGPEGAATGLLATADVVVTDIRDALDLLTNPLRLKATLRD